MSLTKYLEDKPLYYDKIDYTRMPRAYESIRDKIKLPKIIQIVGTNGKGSTGRFLANMLKEQNLSVGHYTSPHIFKFNERIWLNGKDVSDEMLEIAHQKLQRILSEDFIKSLSYFEYTTFLAVLIFEKKCDYIILEAGLGGEYDATSVFPKILSIVTPIGLDHQNFLGDNLQDIALTKLKSATNKVLVSRQYDDIVKETAKKICVEKKAELYFCEKLLLPRDKEKIENFVLKNALPDFQKLNLETAVCALNLLGLKTNMENLTTLQGRCQKISTNITVDVGHNIMAATTLVNIFKDKKITLVYNSFKDKNYESILQILTPIIKSIEILPIQNQRGMATKGIRNFCEKNSITVSDFLKIDSKKDYLVFGSFVVVEEFLKLMDMHEK
jgi:dihydrofolate synthase/folylpolyglutamate synthase